MLFYPAGDFLDGGQVGAINPDPHAGPDAALQHDDSSRNRLQFGRNCSAENRCRFHDFTPYVIRFPNASPRLPAWVERRIQGRPPQAERPAAGIRNQLVVFIPHKAPLDVVWLSIRSRQRKAAHTAEEVEFIRIEPKSERSSTGVGQEFRCVSDQCLYH